MRSLPLRSLVIATLALLPVVVRAALPDSARGAGPVHDGQTLVEATLELDRDPAASGEWFRAGVLLEIERGWHVYWRNPGDSGLATELRWEIDDAELGALGWPAPEVFRESDGLLTTYGYADSVLFVQPVRLQPGSEMRQVRAEIEFLVCKVQCIPGRFELVRGLRVAAASVPAAAQSVALFDRFAARVPRPASEDPMLSVQVFYSQSAIRPGDEFRAALVVSPDRLATDAHHAFVPDEIPSITLAPAGASAHPFAASGALLALEGRAGARDPGHDQRLRGVLALRDPRGERRFVEVDLPLPRARPGAAIERIDSAWLAPASSSPERTPFARAVGLALLGGLILNLMPCVLPVLAIKAVAIAELARSPRRDRIAQGIAYAAGVLASMTGLAAVVAGLRAAGTQVGWGFQFQEPLFVAAISVLLLVLALNLFGVFELSLDASRLARVGEHASGTRRSFLDGLLTVILATPCSAPFLGTAVGFAFASATPVIFAIFAAIGVGLALPYLLVTLTPAAARLIPRSGPWMVQLRRALGFALIATVVWLLWVMGQATGTQGMTWLLACLVGVALFVWVYGAFQAAGRPRAALGTLAAGMAALSLGIAALPIEPETQSSPLDSPLRALPFDRERIQASLQEGRPVFVYFTADWCLTCKVTERLVLGDRRVHEELDRLRVATFKADWTRRDERIRTELESLGKAGVPAYVVYAPAAPTTPNVLPELLTPDTLISALRTAASP